MEPTQKKKHLLAQMQADMVNQPGAQGFTSDRVYVPGGAGALPQATSVPQTPQVAGSNRKFSSRPTGVYLPWLC